MMLCLDQTPHATIEHASSRHPSSHHRELLLASRSPRRRLLLRQAGFSPRILVPDVDDSDLAPGRVSPHAWVEALAYLKARAAAAMLSPSELDHTVVLAADTLAIAGDTMIGKPTSPEHAHNMLSSLMDAEHEVVTGVCVIAQGRTERFNDSATVRFGQVSPYWLSEYIDSGDWQGKAAGYNLSERLEAGWPITFEGDATTIMGLPMGTLAPRLRELMGVALAGCAA